MRERILYQRDFATWLGLSSIALSAFAFWSDSSLGPRVSLEGFVALAVVAIFCGMGYLVVLFRQQRIWLRHVVLTLGWLIVHAVIGIHYIS